MVKQQKVNILLTTITPLNIHHLQLGLYTIQAYFLDKMKRQGDAGFKFDIKVIYPKKRQGHRDYFPVYTKKEIRNIAAGLLKSNPSVIGFSSFMWNIDALLSVAREIKKRKKDVRIVFGGPEVSYQAEELLERHGFIDVVAINDGEETFYELMQCLFRNRGELKDVKGIAYRQDKKTLTTPGRETVLETIPSPYLNRLVNINTKERSLVVETLRGCPFRCAYCSYHLGSYGKVRYFPVAKVKKELRLLLKNNVPHVIITDDNFNIDEKRAEEILETIAKYKKKTAIDAFMNIYIRKVSPELAGALSRARLFLSIGIQSVNSRTLKTINRRSELSLLEHNLEILQQHGLLFDLQFIIGLPGDTFDNFRRNLEWALRFKPYKVSFFPLSVMHGTDMYHMASAYDIRYTKDPPYLVIRTKTFSPGEIVLANQIFNTVNLLYNLGLLKQSLVYLNERLGIDYFSVFSQWNSLMHDKKLQNKNLPPLVMAFVTKLLARYSVPLTQHVHLFDLVRRDLSFYYARHYRPAKTV